LRDVFADQQLAAEQLSTIVTHIDNQVGPLTRRRLGQWGGDPAAAAGHVMDHGDAGARRRRKFDRGCG
jgi:hypothetical protein